MSGLEVAGVVLGVFPLVVSGLRFYYEGCEKIKEMRHHREVLKEFIREIDMESAKFINTCENLFEDIAPEHVAELTTACAPQIWKSDDVQARLRARLKGNCVQQFADSAERVMSILENMRTKFAHDDVPPNKASAKKLRKVFNLALLEDYRKTQVSSLRKINADLYQLVNAAILTPPPAPPKLKSSGVAAYYKRIRDQAATIYGAVKEKLQPPSCQCQNTHVVGMRLEVWKDEKRSFSDVAPGQGIKFTLAFTFDEGEQGKAEWRESELECLEADDNDSAIATPTPPHVMEKTDSGYFSLESSVGELEAPPPPYRDRTDSVSSQHAPRRSSKLKSVSFLSVSPSISPCTSPSLSHTLSRSPSKSPSLSRHPNSPPSRLTPFSRPTTEPEPVIANLCSLLHYHTPPSSPVTSPYLQPPTTPLGLLLPPSTLAPPHHLHRHRLYPPRTLPPSHTYTTTLHSLLSRASRRNMSTEDRLLLGIKLANSVLSLHDTAWLKETWTTKDIIFLSATKTGANPLLERPLVRQVLKQRREKGREKEREKQRERKKSLVQFRNRSLFALGIALMELWYNLPFEKLRQEVEEELREEADNDDDEENDSLDSSDESEDEFAPPPPPPRTQRGEAEVSFFDAAVHIVNAEWLAKDAGRLYGDVVRRCVVGLDMASAEWGNEEFRKGCVEAILGPLEENFRAFRGEL